jgi:hypothetical protein
MSAVARNITWLILVFALYTSSCTAPAATDQRAVETAWQDFLPLTASRSRVNWDVVEVTQVKGGEVAKQFSGINPFYCVAGRSPQKMKENETIDAAKTYWQVHFRPKPVTAIPHTRISPTEPPAIPEPNLRDVYYLLDLSDLHIVARAFGCVIF